MKRIKEKISFILVLLLSVFVGFTNVYASGSATYKFAGPTTATVGQEITITLAIDNISGVTGGIKGFSGNIQVSDATVLELQSGTAHSGATISGGFNKTAMKFNGLGMNGNIESTETIYDFKFKALKNGTATITVINGKISDTNSQAATVSVTPITVTVGAAAPKSNDATLKALSTTAGALSPAFASGTITYSLPDQANSVSQITFTATPNDTKATVQSGTTCNLTAGQTNACKIVVKAEDGTTKTYTVNVKREAAATQPSSSNPNPGTQSNDADLTALGVTGYSLSPSFNKDTLTYTVDVPKTASKVTITATKSNSKATVTGTGDVTLAGENKSQTVTVTAEDGTTKTYTININLVEPVVKDTDNKLKSLEVTGKTLSPSFSPDKTSYTLTVGANVNSIDVKALPNSEKASVSISGTTGLKAGNNYVTVKVTAEDGSIRTYTITVVKEQTTSSTTTKKGDTTTSSSTSKPKSSDTTVDNIIIKSPHTIDPAFSNNENSYNLTVPYEVEKLDVSVFLKDPNAKYTIENNEGFLVGEVKPVVIKITAEDGTPREIYLNVKRTPEEDGTKAKDIKIGGGIDIDFDPDILDYSIDVGSGVKKIDFTDIKVPEGSKYKIIGNENLKEGKNTVIVSVTDKNGYTRNYTFTVRKAAKTILGMKPFVFWIVLGIILLLLLLLLLLFFLRRKKEEEEEEKTQPIQPVPPTPVIDFKPEFNFGSRNGTDDDTVYTGGSLNQDSTIGNKTETENKLPHREEPKYIDTTKEDAKEIPYDPYDEIVTKDELIDAIHEGLASKNPEKLKMLLEQEELNRKKEALRKKEEEDR